jgi:DNA-binding response OmpR family regulator
LVRKIARVEELIMKTQQILIVDDDEHIRTMVGVCLEQEGYVLQQAANGVQALEMIHRDQPDLVLLDLAMPVMDGMTLLAEIRALLPERRVRVIVMTAHGSVRTAIAAVRLGASDFLQKPLSPEEIRQSVASVLHEAPPHLQMPAGGYGEVLQAVRKALRAGEFAAAESALMKAGSISDDDPAFLNLAGVLHESHGRVNSAQHFYERAAAINSRYEPAQENLRRLAELRRHGSSQRKVAFGDGDVRGDQSTKTKIGAES